MLLPVAQINFILASLAQNGYLHEACLLSPAEHSFLKNRDIVAAIAGNITIADKTVQLCVGVRENFPRSLPVIFLRPPNAFGLIPHLDDDGYICYIQTEGLLLNTADPVGILYDAIERAIAVVQSGINGRNHRDFMDELPLYWERDSMETLPGFFSVDDVLRKVFVYSDNKGNQFVTDSIEIVQAYFNGRKQGMNALNRRGALYIPLNEGVFVMPPHPQRRWTSAIIQQLIQANLSWENRQRFARLIRKRKFKEFMVLGLPRPSGGRTLAGLDFAHVHRGSSSRDDKVPDSPHEIAIHRYDSGYLLPRGGGQPDLGNFKAILVGCGSVGGYIAVGLVQSGIRHLTLVDADRLTRENTFRHVLGMSAEGQHKVTALQHELELKYPYLSLTTHQTSIEEAIRSDLVNPSAFDLVIIAIGDPTAELYLNQLLHKEYQRSMAVFTWVEPYSIGGHALLTRLGQPGCLQCLFAEASDPDTPLHNRSSFAAYGQFFGKNDLGCDSLYTPFGGLDAQKTAEQAVRLALDGLLNHEKQSPILSWKGRSEAFTDAGFKLSPRYQQTEDQLRENRYCYINPSCPVCRIKR